jgi:hypothetical protein
MLEFTHGGSIVSTSKSRASARIWAISRPSGRRSRQGTGRGFGAGGRRDARSRRQCARTADRREGSHSDQAVLADRTPGAWGGRPAAREGTDTDRSESHRRHGTDWPRPARAHHWRPSNGEDRCRHRRDHQPARQGRHLYLQRDRAETVDRGAGRADARRVRRDELHHRGRGHGVGSRSDATLPLRPTHW